MAPRRRRRNQDRVIQGQVLHATTMTGDEYPPGGGLPKEWDKKPTKSETPIFDQMMAERFTGHYMVG